MLNDSHAAEDVAMSAAWPGSDTGLLSGGYRYQRRRPENTLLYQLVADLYPCFVQQMAREGRPLPACVRADFEVYLRCGLLQHGFLRVQCTSCHAERLVAFSCKRRGFCPSCGARRMAETATLLVDDILPRHPGRSEGLYAASPSAPAGTI